MAEPASVRETHQEGFEELTQFWDRLSALEEAVASFADGAPEFVEEPVERVLDRIQAFEPSVSVIGQIKAGKSTLLNALIGEVGLLPSDVNPWTSVITALHLNSLRRPPNTAALFRFFDAHEWDRLVATGGRLGEMAQRAGFDAEAEEVRAQVTEMRQTTEARLGDEFESLLGASHAYAELRKDVIDRYICYGDPDDMAEGATEGVYADITKAADLYVDLPHLPRGLCLRDTPGVNDTFMMREQITLNAISDSRVCVVVLSAHQALTTMDLAVLRIILSVEAREVLIFVNRIDELADPVAESGNIAASIRRTLAKTGLADGIEILFGSGYWANAALAPGACTMAPASRAALERMPGTWDLDSDEGLRAAAMEASGVPALHRAIARRVVEGPGREFMADISAEVDAIAGMSETVEAVAAQTSAARPDFGADDLEERIATLHAQVLSDFDSRARDIRDGLRERLERGRQTFVITAIEALDSHIRLFGEAEAWTHDPMALRMAMKTAFNASVSRLRREGEGALDNIFDGMQMILQEDLGVFREGAGVDFPEQPQHRAPTVLARTLTLDLAAPWWRRFWKLGRARAAEKRYRQMIEAETTPMIDALVTQFYDPAAARTRALIETFARDQAAFARAIMARAPRPDSGAPIDERLSA